MKKLFSSILLVIGTLFMLASCGGGEEGKYDTKVLTAYSGKKAIGKMELRFYENTPNVPYVGISQYLDEFTDGQIDGYKTNTIYKYAKNENSYMMIDSATNILVTRDLMGLIGVDDTGVENIFLKKTNRVSTKSSDFLIDLDDYGIEVYGAKNDCYVPFAFANSIIVGEANTLITYNGDAIYVYTDATNGDTYGEEYYRHLNSSEERSEDVIKYNYNLLCFSFDKLRGYTSQMEFVDFNIVSMGLDGTLTTYYPKIKELLMSKSHSDYKMGLFALFFGLYDGGHTVLMPNNYYNLTDQEMEKMGDMEGISDLLNNYAAKQLVRGINIAGATKIKAFGDAVSFVDSDGKTKAKPFYYYFDNQNKIAYIAFDNFVTDYDEWKNYYAGDKNALNLLEREDSYAFVLSSLKRAKTDGAKNVVFDFTTNDGGDLNSLLGIFGIINGAKTEYTFNYIPERRRTSATYDVDVNLDGKFDEDDVKLANELKKSYKVSILTSEKAFSCGNLMPSKMKDAGFTVIGQKSGGGSCVIRKDATLDGMPYYRSGSLTLSNKRGENIDGGVPVDFPILDEYGNLDCEKAFNTTFVSNYLNSLS